jgi:outer membrane protein OmpA-like peptidoglycan-associated protein
MFIACGPPPVPRELAEARANYTRASSGAAREVAPVELDNAHQALNAAEDEFHHDPNSAATRDAAYIADRKAQLAMAHANQVLAEQLRSRAQQELDRLRSQREQRTEAELSRARAELIERQRQLAVSQQQVSSGQQQLAASQQSLEEERRARAEAERTAAAALESLRRVAEVREESRGLVITLSGSVLFASGESVLLPIAQQRLDQVAQTLADHRNQNIVIEGHTDSRGSASANERLSQARADAVRTYLVSRSVPAERVRAVGLGSSRPVADNNTADGRANNRRVEIIVQPPQAGAAQ